MLISVVIPTYNRESTVAKAIQSVIEQTYKNFDIYVIDDGSTDSTKSIIEKTKAENPTISINYLYKTNGGVSSARNLGIKKSSGEWIAFLDSDDEWLPNKLKLQTDFINNNPDIRLVHGNEKWIRNGKHLNQKKVHTKSGGDIFIQATELCLISPSATIIKRDLLEEMNGFDEQFTVCEDYDLWLKITSKYSIGFIKEEILIKHGGHADQLSRKFFAMDYWRVKALNNLLTNQLLRSVYKKQVIEVLIKKSQVLLSGYLKHNNMLNYDEINNILNTYTTDC